MTVILRLHPNVIINVPLSHTGPITAIITLYYQLATVATVQY